MLKQQTRPRALQQSIAIFFSQITFYFISTRNQLPSIVREGTEAGATVMEQGVNLLANRAFSLTWPASMLIYWNKRKFLHKKRVQLPQDYLGTPTWPPFHCFGTPIWPPWRHVKTLYFPLPSPFFSHYGNMREHINFVGKPVLKIILYGNGLTQGYSTYGGSN